MLLSSKYWLTFHHSIASILEYRFNLITHIIKYSIFNLLMGMVWYATAHETGSTLSGPELLSYFVISGIIFGLSNFHAYYIEEDISTGNISKFLTRPLPAFWAYFAQESGTAVLEMVIKAMALIPVLAAVGFTFPANAQQYALLLCFLPLIFLFSFSFFAIFSFMAFWFTEIYALRWGVAAGMRFMAGFFVPISLMPLWFQNISFYLPFQHLGTTPILLMQNGVDALYGLKALLILMFWTACAYYLQQKIWSTAVRTFEGVGI